MTYDIWRVLSGVGAIVISFACSQVSDGWRWYKQVGFWLAALAVYLLGVEAIERVLYP